MEINFLVLLLSLTGEDTVLLIVFSFLEAQRNSVNALIMFYFICSGETSPPKKLLVVKETFTVAILCLKMVLEL